VRPAARMLVGSLLYSVDIVAGAVSACELLDAVLAAVSAAPPFLCAGNSEFGAGKGDRSKRRPQEGDQVSLPAPSSSSQNPDPAAPGSRSDFVEELLVIPASARSSMVGATAPNTAGKLVVAACIYRIQLPTMTEWVPLAQRLLQREVFTSFLVRCLREAVEFACRLLQNNAMSLDNCMHEAGSFLVQPYVVYLTCIT
jgi:hypothetical protein